MIEIVEDFYVAEDLFKSNWEIFSDDNSPDRDEFRLSGNSIPLLMKVENKLVGYIIFSPLHNKLFEIHIGIIDKFRGKSNGAFKAALNYIFENYQVNKLNATIAEWNASVAKFGIKYFRFKEEGRIRNFFWRRGKPYDGIIIGLTYEDWING